MLVQIPEVSKLKETCIHLNMPTQTAPIKPVNIQPIIVEI